MPLPIRWTPGLDSQLRRLRADGASWDAIAHAFGMSRNTALERGRQLGFGRNPLPCPPPSPPPPPQGADRIVQVERPPLASGHAVSWGAITDGTLLAGIAYPPWSLDRAAPEERSPARAACLPSGRRGVSPGC